MPHLSALHVYPLKSAAGTSVQEMRVERRGPARDRRWMGVTPEGDFLSQREHPRLALVQVEATPDGLRLQGPDAPPLDVPRPDAKAPTRSVTVWGDDVDARLASDDAHAWLSHHLRMPVRLVYMPETAHRAVDDEYAVQPDDAVSFADGYPVLLTNEASLADLNARMDAPVPMDRFRPNLVVADAGAWAEDDWRVLRIGSVPFDAVKPCGRCSVTTVDQSTAAPRGPEPLRTLATFRQNPDTGKVDFGWNLIPRSPGTVRVGDEVEVVETR